MLLQLLDALEHSPPSESLAQKNWGVGHDQAESFELVSLLLRCKTQVFSVFINSEPKRLKENRDCAVNIFVQNKANLFSVCNTDFQWAFGQLSKSFWAQLPPAGMPREGCFFSSSCSVIHYKLWGRNWFLFLCFHVMLNPNFIEIIDFSVCSLSKN